MILARALAAAFVATSILTTGAASAQIWPAAPVTLIVPYPALAA
jgi:tripartite-type tricarboxylate transporter receptor subunit TctC